MLSGLGRSGLSAVTATAVAVSFALFVFFSCVFVL